MYAIIQCEVDKLGEHNQVLKGRVFLDVFIMWFTKWALLYS